MYRIGLQTGINSPYFLVLNHQVLFYLRIGEAVLFPIPRVIILLNNIHFNVASTLNKLHHEAKLCTPQYKIDE